MEEPRTEFERALARRLRAELDAIDARPAPFGTAAGRVRRFALVPALAAAIVLALVLGAGAAVAQNKDWVDAVKQSFGIRPGEHATPPGVPAESPEASPEPGEASPSAEPSAPAEHESPEPTAAGRESPEPSSPHESPEPDDGHPHESPGDG